jgi:hypothetical protein
MDRIETEAPAAVECRALALAGSASAARDERIIPRSSAAFVAQLLAVKAGLPQTRERRRADPDEATHCYEKRMSPAAPGAGRVLSRAA